MLTGQHHASAAVYPRHPLRLEHIPQSNLVILFPDLFHDHMITTFFVVWRGVEVCVFLRCYVPTPGCECFLAANKSCMQKVQFIIDGISA